jgi:hypothetical protein
VAADPVEALLFADVAFTRHVLRKYRRRDGDLSLATSQVNRPPLPRR